MAKGNRVFRKVMEGNRNRAPSPETPKQARQRAAQEAHVEDVRKRGARDQAKLQRDEELDREYQAREAERRRRKTD